MDNKAIPIAAIQHYAYCPRQCALIHNEQAWAENWFTVKGQVLHQKVDSGEPESRKGVRFERSVMVNAPILGITGRLDLLEVEAASRTYTPVEYKSGKSKIESWDRQQVCAQAMAIEEMLGVTITKGALWYWRTKRREVVDLSEELRSETLQTIQILKQLFESQMTPKSVVSKKRCKACSLIDLCQPDLLRNDHSQDYWDSIFKS
ncbi:MAG: CRISPR-associated protein Cas4 [Pseudomonadales bacterium]|nr:CRISPR-associated protein Cas4 [Pseudomonadales bacterium]